MKTIVFLFAISFICLTGCSKQLGDCVTYCGENRCDEIRDMFGKSPEMPFGFDPVLGKDIYVCSWYEGRYLPDGNYVLEEVIRSVKGDGCKDVIRGNMTKEQCERKMQFYRGDDWRPY